MYSVSEIFIHPHAVNGHQQKKKLEDWVLFEQCLNRNTRHYHRFSRCTKKLKNINQFLHFPLSFFFFQETDAC